MMTELTEFSFFNENEYIYAQYIMVDTTVKSTAII